MTDQEGHLNKMGYTANPYAWDRMNECLVHRGDGHVVGTLDDFPGLKRQLALTQRRAQRIYNLPDRAPRRSRSGAVLLK